jgi:hypothetical protein
MGVPEPGVPAPLVVRKEVVHIFANAGMKIWISTTGRPVIYWILSAYPGGVPESVIRGCIDM